ncbi:MAG TPA: hypothetical protein VE546_03920 [Streptomyces sp.]|uniref:hypothetical protein n=1 Tax=Streptomyces sp. TaxID=1931 RepID=UPI002D2F7C62|nr:hypothetical protein [Streptomyces sp.]HZG02722.1 hypothetical protein [Streptomyces sp.]
MTDQQYPHHPQHPLPQQPQGEPYDPYGGQQYGAYGEQPYGGQQYGSYGEQPYGGQGEQAYGGQPYGPPPGPYGAPGSYGVPQGAASLPPQYPGPGPLPPERGGPAADAPAPGTAEAAGAAGTTGSTATATATASAPAPRRTGDPIIPPGLLPAALTAVLAVLLAGAAAFPRPVLAVPVVLLQAVTAAGWYRLNGMWPARQGIALAFLAGVTADVALLTAGAEHAPIAAIGTLGVWCVLVLALQLRNHSSPDERLYALTAGVASTALAVLAGGFLAAEPHAVTVGALAVAAATLARALPLPSVLSLGVAVLAAAGAGIAAGQFTSLGTAGAVLGLAAGVCALIGLRVASYDFPSRFVHMTAGVALPLTAAVPAVYLLGRALA